MAKHGEWSVKVPFNSDFKSILLASRPTFTKERVKLFYVVQPRWKDGEMKICCWHASIHQQTRRLYNCLRRQQCHSMDGATCRDYGENKQTNKFKIIQQILSPFRRTDKSKICPVPLWWRALGFSNYLLELLIIQIPSSTAGLLCSRLGICSMGCSQN